MLKKIPLFHNEAGTTKLRKRKRPSVQPECDGIIASGTIPGPKKLFNIFPSKHMDPVPSSSPPPKSNSTSGVVVQAGLLAWAKKDLGLLLQNVENKGFCGYDSLASILGVTRTKLLLTLHTAVAPYNKAMVDKHCYGRHFGNREPRATVFKTAMTANAANEGLGGDCWMEMDDALIVTHVHQTYLLMFSHMAMGGEVIQGKMVYNYKLDPFPIRLYTPLECLAKRNIEEYTATALALGVHKGIKGLAHSHNHFNALVLENEAPTAIYEDTR
jgi:hypothetical protein